MSEIGGVYLSGGAGNDNVGLISPYHGYHGDTSVLVGGAELTNFIFPSHLTCRLFKFMTSIRLKAIQLN